MRRVRSLYRSTVVRMLASTVVSAVAIAGVWSTVQADSDSVERDLTRVRQRELERPRLRINSRGHAGTVMALAFTPDSGHLCSAGLDKVVQVWNLKVVGRDLRRTHLLERTIRWQVARGPRGSIFSLAMSPADGTMALAGYGALGVTGEILLVDPLRGTLDRPLVDPLRAHRQAVSAMSFSPNGNWLASIDLDGRSVLWKRGDWKPLQLYGSDAEFYKPQLHALIQRQTRIRSIVMAGNEHVIVPWTNGALDARGRPLWKLLRINVNTRRITETLESPHAGMVLAMATSKDGRRMVSSDDDGRIYFWQFGNITQVQSIKLDQIARTLALGSDGKTVAVGLVGPVGERYVRLYDFDSRQVQLSRSVPDQVAAVALSPDGKRLAYAGGENHQVHIETLGDDAPAKQLVGAGRRIWKLAFAKAGPGYRLAFGTDHGPAPFNAGTTLREAFDFNDVEIAPGQPLDPADYLADDWAAGDWQMHIAERGTRLQLYQQNQPKGFVALDPRTEGRIRCAVIVPDANGRPAAVAVGTDVQNSVYVMALTQQGPCPILRYYRAHQDDVNGLAVSRDGRYLASSSADGTINVWSLTDIAAGRAPRSRWGAELTVQNNRLMVTQIYPEGPLHRRGFRQGDQVTRLRWFAGGKIVEETQPAEMLKQLRDCDWNTQVIFDYQRGRTAMESFQLVPAWQPLASLLVDGNREWALWTPEGYYDASINGHTLFGWQVNRGIERMPDFYRADQYRRTLERPDVMEKLLPAGNLQDAFRLAALVPPEKPEETLTEHISNTPTVEILSPAPGTVVAGASTKVRAKVRMPGKSKLITAKVFANGVAARSQQLVAEQELPEGRELTYEFDTALPNDQSHLIQVSVSTDAPTAAFDNVVVSQEVQSSDERPKLYVLSVGINDYSDDNIQPLTFSVADAQSVTKLLTTGTQGLYQVQTPTVLINGEVTRAKWKASFSELAERLKRDVKPNDLLVLFLAGHGFVDQKSQKYYYASYDFTVEKYLEGSFEDCISWEDFEQLADVPCRKLAFLDTCHSGAIQPLRERNLKAAIRAFQEDVVFTVTGSTGSEKAAENPKWGHGAFTKCLLEGLAGRADTSEDGSVSLPEVIAYVKQEVPALTDDRQHPTAGPNDLLPYISLRLTLTSKPGEGE